MIYVGKAPYRISLLGGGSDLDWFVEDEEFGLSIGYSLDRYTYSVLQPMPYNASNGILNYSSREIYDDPRAIVHPLIRSAFARMQISSYVQLCSFGFASGGSGLGGSSSFLLSLLAAISHSQSRKSSKVFLADLASNIEIIDLRRPIGRQDQYLCALGGVNALEFRPNGNVNLLTLSNEKRDMLLRVIDNLFLVPSSITRSADKVLHAFRGNSVARDKMRSIRDIAASFIQLNEDRDAQLEIAFHQAVSESWNIKKEMSNVMDSELTLQLSLISQLPINWTRLVGAGAGGYFLVSPKSPSEEFTQSLKEVGFSTFFKAQLTHNGVSSLEI